MNNPFRLVLSDIVKDELNIFLKSAVLATDVYFVNDKEKDFCGLIIDEDVLPSVSYYKIGGYQENAPEDIVGLKVKTLQKCLKFDDIQALEFNATYLNCIFEDKAEIDVPYVYVDKDKSIIDQLINDLMSVTSDNKINEIDGEKVKFAMKHLMIPRVNYKLGGYEIAVLNKDKSIVFGNNNHLVIVPNILNEEINQNINFHSSLLNKISNVLSKVEIFEKDSYLVAKVSDNLLFLGAKVDAEFVNYQGVFEADTKSKVDFGDNLSSLISGLEKLSIPLMIQDDKIISIKETDKKSFIKIAVDDLSGLESYVIVPAIVNKESDDIVDFALFFEPFEKIVKNVNILSLEEKETALILNGANTDGFNVIHILAKVMI